MPRYWIEGDCSSPHFFSNAPTNTVPVIMCIRIAQKYDFLTKFVGVEDGKSERKGVSQKICDVLNLNFHFKWEFYHLQCQLLGQNDQFINLCHDCPLPPDESLPPSTPVPKGKGKSPEKPKIPKWLNFMLWLQTSKHIMTDDSLFYISWWLVIETTNGYWKRNPGILSVWSLSVFYDCFASTQKSL